MNSLWWMETSLFCRNYEDLRTKKRTRNIEIWGVLFIPPMLGPPRNFPKHFSHQRLSPFPLRTASTLELAWVRCFMAPAHRTHARCFGHSSKPPKVRSKNPCDWAIKWIDRMRPNGPMWDVSWNIILGYSPNRRYTPILSIQQQDCITPPGESQ